MNSEQYAEKIQNTREDIDRTLQSLESRLSLREWWDQALKWSEGAKDFSANLARAVREHPVPAALMGISLVWLMTSSTAKRLEGTDVSGIKEKLQGKYSEIHGKYGEMRSTLRDTSVGAGDRIRDFSSEMKRRGENLREQGQQLKEKVRAGGAELSARPVLLAALGLAAGAVIAMSLPVSRKEKETLGEAGREMYRRGSRAVGEQVERGRQAASAAAEAAKERFMGETGEEYGQAGIEREWSTEAGRSPNDYHSGTH